MRPESYQAVCAVCGQFVTFEDSHKSIRESYGCPECKATLRYRHQADTIVIRYSRHASNSLRQLVREARFRSLAIYEPGIAGPFRSILGPLDGYVYSSYCEVPQPRNMPQAPLLEDLQALSFEDESFDLMISSDMLEHVRHPMQAFREAHRVLRPDGCYIFTIPVTYPLTEETVVRVDVSGDEDRHILPPVYHKNPLDPEGSLVYNDFGADLVDQLEEIGFEVRCPRSLGYNLTFALRKAGG